MSLNVIECFCSTYLTVHARLHAGKLRVICRIRLRFVHDNTRSFGSSGEFAFESEEVDLTGLTTCVLIEEQGKECY